MPHHWQAISPIAIDVTVLRSVCLSPWHVHVLCSNGRRYRKDFIRRRQHHVSPGSC